MTTRHDDESALLLGALALRLELARRDHLLVALNAWSEDRSGTVADRLRTTPGVDPAAIAIAEAVRDRLVGLHGDARTAMRALGAARDLEIVAGRLVDPSIQTTLGEVCPSTVAAAETSTWGPSAAAGPDDAPLSGESSRFRVRRLHARGGLGEVFVADDHAIGREVALKEIKPRYADDPESRSRFIREARITGCLEHPGIVPVHALGRHPDGRPFYVMRFIDGESLDQSIAAFHGAPAPKADPGERSLELRRLLGRFVDVCRAIQYAHSRGVLHRDIKPANIMLGRFGEAIVVDWGLGKVVGGPDPDAADLARDWTQPGATLGTPAYMSPEQASGRSSLLGPASDIYSLGATLFCVLTGRPPIEGKGREPDKVLGDVRRGQFPRPRQVNPRVSRTLEAICLKAMALKPSQRYESAAHLAGDLERWLAGEPVSAYREPAHRRVWRWGRRNRWVAAAIGAASVVIVTVFLFSSLLIAPLALCLALVGGSVGALVGVIQGRAGAGAQKGAEFGFRVGTIAILALFLALLTFVTFRLVAHPGPGARPTPARTEASQPRTPAR